MAGWKVRRFYGYFFMTGKCVLYLPALAWHMGYCSVGSGGRNVQPFGLLSSPDPQVSDPYGRWNVPLGVYHGRMEGSIRRSC